MPNPDLVCTRFFFVYEDGQVGGLQYRHTVGEIPQRDYEGHEIPDTNVTT